jgi:N-acetylglucosaminyl-diphospho-decaprenol L-rhamnosyltransferase
MNKNLTIIFNAYFSNKNLYRVLKTLKKYKVIIIENSLDKKLKLDLEKKYSNVNVVIPNKNLGLAKGYNLGIKCAKTKYVFLNNPDIEISNHSINQLILCAQKIKKFSIISPIYDDEKIFKNYSGEQSIKNKDYFFSKNKIRSVNWMDNNFFIDRQKIKKDLFDENYFLYFETLDFCFNLKKKYNDLFISKKIKFKHYGSMSTDIKYQDIVYLTRAWHYNWSKFYYYRKNFNYIYALRKILPNLIQAIKKVLINAVKFNKFYTYLSLIEIYGIMSSILCLKSFYRPKIEN